MKKKFFTDASRLFLQLINPSLVRPISGRIIITENCPLRCKMCTFWKNSHDDPSLETIKYWIKEMADFGIKDIDIGGGEPFIRKDLLLIVEEVKAHGMTCGLTTSGWLVGKVPFPALDRCEISIDGIDAQTHDRIRGVEGSFDQAIEAIKIAKRYCKVTQLNFVLQPDNYKQLDGFCRLANRLQVPRVGVIPVSLKLAAQACLSPDLNDFEMPLLEKVISDATKFGNIGNNMEFIRIALKKLKKGSFPQVCFSGYNCVLIFTNGDVYPCGNFDVPVGNLAQGGSLRSIYRDYASIRKEIAEGLHERCSRCIYPDIITKKTLFSNVALYLRKKLKKPNNN